MPHYSPGTLVFSWQRPQQNLNGITSMGAPNAGGVG